MSEETTVKQKEITWVRLHLVPQNENNAMPPFLVGILTQETKEHYVLMKVLSVEETDDGWDTVQSPNMYFVNRTYVWACEVLAEPPQLSGFGEVYTPDMGGGLG